VTAPRARFATATVVAAAVAGVLFGVGLGISGMARPTKVLAFLDVAGAWDPSLAFVMMGAIGVHAIAVVVAKRRTRAIVGSAFRWTDRTELDAPLLAGSLLFGVGWGLGGFCPGPALLGAASGNAGAIVFVIAMIAGMVGRHVSMRSAAARTS
jgi:uncharacterized membrane protein YedE/YeeE